MNEIHLGDCLDVLKTLPDNSVDSVITDPPYGLGTREPTVDEIVEYLQGAKELDTKGDFMGRKWSIPPVEVWKECFRVLKPGGHLLTFGGTRTFDIISLGVRAAGFECRDTVASQFGVQTLQWVYGQGMPKSHNVGKALEKQGADPEVAEKYTGVGTALKPSWEPILVFRKPLEGTVVQNVLKHGTGGVNIDACRVGSPKGRWPANVHLTHSQDCTQTGSQKVKAPVINRFDDGAKPFGNGAGHKFTSEQQGDADGMEEILVYECVEGCPVSVLDKQSGISKSTGGRNLNITPSSVYDGGKGLGAATRAGKATADEARGDPGFGDTGGASRFFGQCEPDAPFLYAGKVTKKEREGWLPKGEKNPHPTMKSIKLMEWLVKLVTPKNAVVLDPYCGSGTTCVAAMRVGCKYVGIERDPEFHAIATQRVEALRTEAEEKVALEDAQRSFEASLDSKEVT